MSHPRLTKVLADWCRRHNENLGYADDPDMEAYTESLIATDEEGIAARLEAALAPDAVTVTVEDVARRLGRGPGWSKRVAEARRLLGIDGGQ